MPNHVSNHVYLRADGCGETDEDSADKIKAIMSTPLSPFDFNALIPYPEKFEKMDKAHEEGRLKGLSYFELPKDGFNSGGYEWCCEHWGTKWNAYEVAYDWNGVYFQTAWSTPLPIWEELSKKFPDLELVVEYADEDTGHNCGELVFKNGAIIDRMDEEDDNIGDATMFARAIKAEQESAYYYQQWRLTEKKADALEGALRDSKDANKEDSNAKLYG